MPRKTRGRFETSQPDKRRFNRWRDQHDRIWEAVVDMESGQPIGPLSPYQWSAPLLPPQKFFKFTPLDNVFRIDYGAWIKEREQAKLIYERRRNNYARKLYGERAGEMIERNPPELQRAVGIAPQPVEPVLAAASGNQFVLGLTDVKPAWATEFFPDADPTALTEPSRGLTSAQLRALREQFPDVSSDDEDEREGFDLDALRQSNPNYAKFLDNTDEDVTEEVVA